MFEKRSSDQNWLGLQAPLIRKRGPPGFALLPNAKFKLASKVARDPCLTEKAKDLGIDGETQGAEPFFLERTKRTLMSDLGQAYSALERRVSEVNALGSATSNALSMQPDLCFFNSPRRGPRTSFMIRKNTKSAKSTGSKLNFELLSAFFSESAIELEKDKEVTFHVKNGAKQLILFKTSADSANSFIFGALTRSLSDTHRLPVQTARSRRRHFDFQRATKAESVQGKA